MKEFLKLLALAALIGLFAFGCAAQKAKPAGEKFTPYDFSSGYSKKVDNFLVIFDASTSMSDKYKDCVKLDIARRTISRMNQTIPELGFIGGMRTFGQGPCLPDETTALIYGLVEHSEAAMGSALDTITCTGGNTPLGLAINTASDDLKEAQGKIAVIIISDGLPTEGKTVAAAGDMKKQYGDRLCIYTIQVGDHPGGKALLEEVAKAGQCGFSVAAEDIYSSEGMADFVKKVFLATGNDRDGDGVIDSLDKCPNTPRGAKVDSRGCWVLDNVLFDFDKWDIKASAYERLNRVAGVLKDNPDVKVKIEGHTDSLGSVEYNKGLSLKRANAVKQYLQGKGIAAGRLEPVGFGESRPIASNKTEAGQAKNRRVELTPIR